MDCLVILVSKRLSTEYDEVRNRAIFSTKHYDSFFKRSGVIGKLKSKVSLSCSACDSFVVPAGELYNLIYEPESLFDEKEQEDWNEDFENLYYTIRSLLQNLTEEINATDDEWQSYIEKGTPHLAPLHVRGECIDIPEWAANPVRLRFREVVFKFGARCGSCGRGFRKR